MQLATFADIATESATTWSVHEEALARASGIDSLVAAWRKSLGDYGEEEMADWLRRSARKDDPECDPVLPPAVPKAPKRFLETVRRACAQGRAVALLDDPAVPEVRIAFDDMVVVGMPNGLWSEDVALWRAERPTTAADRARRTGTAAGGTAVTLSGELAAPRTGPSDRPWSAAMDDAAVEDLLRVVARFLEGCGFLPRARMLRLTSMFVDDRGRRHRSRVEIMSCLLGSRRIYVTPPGPIADLLAWTRASIGARGHAFTAVSNRWWHRSSWTRVPQVKRALIEVPPATSSTLRAADAAYAARRHREAGERLRDLVDEGVGATLGRPSAMRRRLLAFLADPREDAVYVTEPDQRFEIRMSPGRTP